MAAGRDLACKEGPGADVTKTTGHSRHTSTRPSLLGNILLDPSLRGGIVADGVASLALPHPIAVREKAAHQQQCADPIWARIFSIWNPSKLHLQTRPSDWSALEL